MKLIMKSKFEAKIFDCLISFRFIIFTFWITVACSLAYFAAMYESKTNVEFIPPKNSESAKSYQFVEENFQKLKNQEPYAFMIEDTTGEYFEKHKNICENDKINDALKAFANKTIEYIKQNHSAHFVMANSYFSTQEKKEYLISPQFCKERAMIVQFAFEKPWDGQEEASAIRKELGEMFSKDFKNYPSLKFSVISISTLYNDMTDGTMRDILVLDGISIFFGLIIVAFFIKEAALLIISIANILVSIITSFGICYFLALRINIITFSAALQSAAIVAFVFDYSLFLFSKLTKELRGGVDPRSAIHEMMESAGHVIVVSGLCLALVFLIMMLSPVEIIQNLSLCTCLTILIFMVVTLSLTPAMLACFPKFFMGQKCDFWLTDILNCNRKKNTDYHKMESSLNNESNDVEKDDASKKNEYNIFERYCCAASIKGAEIESEQFTRKLVQKLTKSKTNSAVAVSIVVVVACILVYPLSQLKYTVDLKIMIPRKSDTVVALNKFGQYFGNGALNPFYIIFQNKQEGKIDTLLNENAFELMQNFTAKLQEQSRTTFEEKYPQFVLNDSNIIAPFFLQKNISASAFKKQRSNPTMLFVQEMISPNVSDLSTFAVMLTPNMEITAQGADEFIKFMRDMMNLFEIKFIAQNISVNEFSMQSPLVDSTTLLFKSLPMVAGVIIVALVLVMLIAFQSIIAPMRLLVEIALVEVFFYGVNTLLFQFWRINGVQGLAWTTVFFMFNFCIGLGCDYDIFSFDSIYRDYRKKVALSDGKVDFQECINAASENLKVVMTAGVIMIVSFSGLLFSSLDFLVQMGCCLIVDIAFDTFVVVPIIVPALTSLIGEVSMWPGGKCKKGSKENSDFEEENEEEEEYIVKIQ